MAARQKVFVVGTDEAGYGPNLGPLVVGASCWQIETDAAFGDGFLAFGDPPAPDGAKPDKKKKKKSAPTGPTLFDLDTDRDDPDATRRLIELLNAGLAPIADRKGIFPLVDSKKLYGASKSLAALERSFLLAAALIDANALTGASFRSVLQRVAREPKDGPAPPWEDGFDAALPLDPKTGAASGLLETLPQIRARFAAEKIALADISARRVQPGEFNALVDRLGLKSDLIANVTLSAAVETVARTSGAEKEPVYVVLCDKLGGRDRYAPILAERFPGAELRVLKESRETSVYRLVAEAGRDRTDASVAFRASVKLEFHFTAKGESNAPTALASICAKYFRELSMKAFNDYWRAAVGPGLAPTAGYPVDALRFRADVDAARVKLGVSEDAFWRKK
ncbi:MAG: hypothetical protein IIU43_09350 [Thermoguttaceae bacterium]|nr:hypothetical protein [Thermoguttaceae bacterium]